MKGPQVRPGFPRAHRGDARCEPACPGAGRAGSPADRAHILQYGMNK